MYNNRIQISDHFWKPEFEYSDTAIKYGIKNFMGVQELTYAARLCNEILEPWRERLGNVPFRSNSLFRSMQLNNHPEMDGSINSAHMSARACDKGLRGHEHLFDDIEEMYKDLISSDIKFDKAIIERNSKGSKWIHVQCAKFNRQPRLAVYRAVPDENGEMQYTEYA